MLSLSNHVSMLNCEVYNRAAARIPQKMFRNLLVPSHRALQKDKRIQKGRHFSFELSLVGNALIRKLNRVHHRKDRVTDVISLSYFQPNMKDRFIGEIFICVPFAKMQAKKIGQSLTDELRFLFIHGLLHLFGYDHKKPKEEVHMKALTYKILGRVEENAV